MVLAVRLLRMRCTLLFWSGHCWQAARLGDCRFCLLGDERPWLGFDLVGPALFDAGGCRCYGGGVIPVP